jgi:arylsulfatase
VGFEETFTLVQGFSGHFGPQPAMVFDGNPIVQVYLRNGEPAEWPEGGYSPVVYTDEMINFIESKREDGQPWFSFMAYTVPHDPIQAPAEWIEKFDGLYDEGYQAVHDARLARMIEMGIVPADTTVAPFPESEEFGAWETLSDEEKGRMSKVMEVYAAMVASLDNEIGRLLTYLEESGELDNTWIFVFSDNGPNGEGQNAYFSEEYINATYDNSEANIGSASSFMLYGGGWGWVSATPLRGYKGQPTEGGIRAPLFIHGPDLARAGEMNDNYAEITDLYPTVLDLAGIDFPAAYNNVELLPLPGQSILPYAMGETETIHSEDAVFGEELWGRAALRKGDWKILWGCPPIGNGAWQLFDLRTDLAELTDLAAENPDKLAELVADYETYVAELGVIGDLGVLPWDYSAGITEACPAPTE